jgi:hypothetical protein
MNRATYSNSPIYARVQVILNEDLEHMLTKINVLKKILLQSHDHFISIDDLEGDLGEAIYASKR